MLLSILEDGMKKKMCFASFTASILAVMLIGICCQMSIDKNLLIYIISLIGFLVVYILIMLTLKISDSESKTKSNVIIGGFYLGIISALGLSYILGSMPFYSFYGWSILPKWCVLIVILLGCWTSISCVIFLGGGNNKAFIPIYFLAIFLYAWSKYNPNIINADTYDADAYLTSIYNVHFNIPYTIETTGIYGHYAIFFKIPMMIFGGDIIAISRMVAAVAAITMASFCYAVNNLIKNNYTRILVILAALLEPLYVLPFSYYQSSPNRYLFPAIMMALISYDMKGSKKINVWIGGAVACLGILWNFESGVVTAAAWFIYLSIKELQNNTSLITHNTIRYFLIKKRV